MQKCFRPVSDCHVPLKLCRSLDWMCRGPLCSCSSSHIANQCRTTVYATPSCSSRHCGMAGSSSLLRVFLMLPVMFTSFSYTFLHQVAKVPFVRTCASTVHGVGRGCVRQPDLHVRYPLFIHRCRLSSSVVLAVGLHVTGATICICVYDSWSASHFPARKCLRSSHKQILLV